MTKEHDLINRYFAPLCSASDAAPAFGLLDDTALLTPTKDQQILVTTDALVAGVHFFAHDLPASIAHKALAVNVSDIVAKGGNPDSYLLTIALPKNIEPKWLQEFASGLGDAQSAFGCQLIGGDTVATSGPLMISITLLGNIETGKMVRRKGAKPGDVVFVSGTIGDAALGLLLRENDERMANAALGETHNAHLLERYLRPQPKTELAPAIAAYGSAAMDISDGLVGDFGKLCAASHVGGIIEAPSVPLSDAASSALAHQPDLLGTILSGGDDYEILAAIPADQADQFVQETGNVTRIGKIVAQRDDITILDAQGQPLDMAHGAYDHFGD